ADGWVQARGRLPSSVTYARHELTLRVGRVKGQPDAVHTDQMPAGRGALHLDLQPLQGRIHEASLTSSRPLFAQDVPGFQGPPDLEHDIILHKRSIVGKPELV